MGKKKSKRKKPVEKLASNADSETFEQALAELEAAVADLENGELGLDESLARYEQGVARLKRCHDALERARRRIELLSGVDADGKPLTKPFKQGAQPVDEGDRLF